MADRLTPAERSENMRRIRSKDTSPELAIRKLLHHLGYRFRLHIKELPGRPDIVLPSRRCIVLVHGCFWHGHSRCREGRVPGSNVGYWSAKLEANKLRDRRNIRKLRNLGWSVLVVWECQVKDLPKVEKRLLRFLG